MGSRRGFSARRVLSKKVKTVHEGLSGGGRFERGEEKRTISQEQDLGLLDKKGKTSTVTQNTTVEGERAETKGKKSGSGRPRKGS